MHMLRHENICQKSKPMSRNRLVYGPSEKAPPKIIRQTWQPTTARERQFMKMTWFMKMFHVLSMRLGHGNRDYQSNRIVTNNRKEHC